MSNDNIGYFIFLSNADFILWEQKIQRCTKGYWLISDEEKDYQ